MNSALGQVDEPRSSNTRQYHDEILGFHPIVSLCSLNDHVVDLDEHFRVA
jgi:hypothetical protein